MNKILVGLLIICVLGFTVSIFRVLKTDPAQETQEPPPSLETQEFQNFSAVESVHVVQGSTESKEDEISRVVEEVPLSLESPTTQPEKEDQEHVAIQDAKEFILEALQDELKGRVIPDEKVQSFMAHYKVLWNEMDEAKQRAMNEYAFGGEGNAWWEADERFAADLKNLIDRFTSPEVARE